MFDLIGPLRDSITFYYRFQQITTGARSQIRNQIEEMPIGEMEKKRSEKTQRDARARARYPGRAIRCDCER